MRNRLLKLFRSRLSEQTRDLVKVVLTLLLYGWTFFVIVLPIALLKWVRVVPLGGMNFPGTSIIRYYWKNFILNNLKDFQGHAAEIDTKINIEKYGKRNLINNGIGLSTASAIDIASSGNEDYIADLSRCWNIPCGQFDMLLVQFTYHMIRKDRDALYHSLRILKPGGVLLCNFPVMSGYFPKGLSYKGYTGYVYRWYSPCLVTAMFEALGLKDQDYTLVVNGNWFAKVLYMGFYIPVEVIPRFLLKDDPSSPILISARIKKPEHWQTQYRPDLTRSHTA